MTTKVRPKRIKVSPEILDLMVNQFKSGKSVTSIARSLGKSETFVKYNLKKLGYTMRKPGDYRTYTLNQNYFDTIDTNQKAYWLGFLYADAYNHEGRNEVKLVLCIKDKEHVAQFNQDIGSNAPIKRNAGDIRGNTVRLDIFNKNFSKSLARLGCVQNKTFKIRYPSIPEEFDNSFMLGFFDGDGCITGNNKKASFSITTNQEFILGYRTKLMNYCKLSKNKLYTKRITASLPRMEKAWSLRYSGRQILSRIFNFLYSSPVYCLRRKKLKFISVLASTKTKKDERIIIADLALTDWNSTLRYLYNNR